MRPFTALLALVVLTTLGAQPCEPPPPTFTGYPTPAKVGTPAGWTPATVHQGDLTVTTPGTVLQDIDVRGSVNVRADNVTIRRARVRGRVWTQHSDGTRLRQYRVTVEDSVLGGLTSAFNGLTGEGVIGPGRYTIRRSELYGSDGFRVSAPQDGGPNDVLIEDNYFRANMPACDQGFHIDGVQGYGGGQNVVVRHNTIDARGPCGVTGAVFFADDSESATVTNNLLLSAGYTLGIHDDHNPDVGPWVITGNRIVSTGYGPASTTGTQCGAASMTWSDNRLATVDGSYNVTSVGAVVPC
jgi:hypothetical protein